MIKVAALTVALLASNLARAEYPIHESFSESHPFPANGEIALSNTNGAVTIQTWDRTEIKIEGEKRAQTEEELHLIGLTIDTGPSSAVIKTKLPNRKSGWFGFGGNTIRAEVRFTLTVPANARLSGIDTVNGHVTINGVRGQVTVRTVNGGVTAKGLAAQTALETVNGSIRAEFADLSEASTVSTRTVNGSTTIALPANASVALRARSVNGSISCDFPIKLEGRKSRTSLAGTIGTGANTLKIDTVNGSIHLNSL